MEPTQREGIRSTRTHRCRILHTFPSCLPLHVRFKVKDEVLSILRLLHPLTEPAESTPPEPAYGENPLDAALAQLQNVARKLAVGHTQQVSSCLTPVLQAAFVLIIVGVLLKGLFAVDV